MHLLDRVRRTIRQHDLAACDTRVVVALSGGSDSVALAHLLIELDRLGELCVSGFAHFNHQLRPSARGDERFCERLAAFLERPLLIDCEDVAALARRERRSIEDAARAARHAFLERARLHFASDVVALGHTRDDQAETFLLRLLRGAGARGLAAMYPRRDAIVRPLLDCRRAELRAFLDRRGATYVEDESNADVRVPRNRVRAELLPLLQQRFNPSIVDVLADEAALAREEWQWMDAAARELEASLCRRSDGVCRVDAVALSAMPPALARLVLKRALTETSGGRAVSFAHVEDALRFSRVGGAPIDLPGQRVERIGPDVVLTGRRAGSSGRPKGHSTSEANYFRYPLSIPGEVWIVEIGNWLSAELVQPASIGAVAGKRARSRVAQNVALVQLRTDLGPLAVRNRRPGDRFRPLGLGGGKKLQDYFVDRKVARDRRDAVPLVVDQGDRIVWVAGHGIDERFRVMDPAQAVVVLRLRQV